MAKGPSPIIPLLLVLILGLVLLGQTLIRNLSLVLEAQDTTFTFILFIPLLACLFIYYTTQTIILPLALILITYMVTKMLLGPLVLILIVYLSMCCGSSYQWRHGNASAGAHSLRDVDENGGWWWMLLAIAFLTLHGMFSLEEGSKWGLALVIVLFFILYNLCIK